MQVTITARHMHLAENTQADFKEKISSIEKYDHKVRYVDVVCWKEHDAAVMEWKIGIDGHAPVIVRTEAQSLSASVDILMDKAEMALTKTKEIRTKKEHVKMAASLAQ